MSCKRPPLSVVLANGIESKVIKVRLCDVLNQFKDLRLIPSGGSPTVVFLGDLQYNTSESKFLELLRDKEIHVVIKLSFGLDPDLDNSLIVEAKIYKSVVNNILSRGYSPNLVGYIASALCKGDVKNLLRNGGEIARKVEERIGEVLAKEPDLDLNTQLVLVLEAIPDGRSLGKYLDSFPPTPSQMFSIIFQTLYTIQVFNHFGLRHNDLHIGNILIDTSDHSNNVYFYFTSEETYYTIPTNILVKIFDFDFSSTDKFINTKLDEPFTGFCKNMGICNGRNIKFDTYTFVSAMYLESRKYTFLKPFCEAVVAKKLLLTEFGFVGRLCNLTEHGCDGDWEPPDDLILPIPRILKTEWFDEFRHTLEEFDTRYLTEEDAHRFFFWPDVDRDKVIKALFSLSHTSYGIVK